MRDLWQAVQHLGYFHGSEDFENYLCTITSNIPLTYSFDAPERLAISEARELMFHNELSLMHNYMRENNPDQVTYAQQKSINTAVSTKHPYVHSS